MKAVLALLLGVAYGGQETAWLRDVNRNWDSLDHQLSFKNWQARFGKNYANDEEEAYRFLQFLDNWEMINDHNSKGEHNYTLGLNQFGDLSVEEFQYYVHGDLNGCLRRKKPAPKYKKDRSPKYQKPKNQANPAAVDWTNVDGKSYVTPVKNQEQCGSCWAFSTTGSLESRYAILHDVTGDDIVTLSEQQLVDCSRSEGNQGCNGGLMDDAFKYVEKSGGLCSEKEYEYTAKDGTCKASSCGTKYDAISGFTDVKKDSYEDLESAVVAGPVSIAVDAAGSTWQFYKGGVVDSKCGTSLDHGVLVVGYGEEQGQKYWKVKNSWGTSWGEEGYILLCKECDKNGEKGECGILEQPSFPLPQK